MNGQDGRFRILYVDDEESNRVIFQQTFQNRFDVDLAASANDALPLVEKNDYAVLLTDQRMPGMTGNQLLRRARDLRPGTERIIITAYEDVEPVLQAINSGLVAKYILKPWVRQELESAILGCIEIWRLRHDRIELQQRLFNAERLATLGTLSAGLLHDVNHFLGVVTSNASWLAERAALIAPVKAALATGGVPDATVELGEGRTAKLSELIGEFESVIGDLSQDATRLFELARNAKGLTDQASGSGDVGEAIGRAVGLLRRRIEAEGATIERNVEPALPRAGMATAGMMQALVNFLLNAVQAKREGVKTVIRIGAKREGEGISFTVRDNGTGMSREVLAKVKQPFFTTKPAGVGTGLGLYATQRLVQDAGGKLEIQSVQNEGTTISVWLPRAP